MDTGHRLGGWFVPVVMFAAALLSACGGRQAPTPQALSEAAPSSWARAEVQQVEVLAPLGESSSLVALVRGTLPSGCYRAGEAAVSPGAGLVVIIIPAVPQPLADGACGGPAAFERVVTLGDAFKPGTYTISVNGVSTAFTVAAPAPAEMNPPAAPVEGSQVASAPEAPSGSGTGEQVTASASTGDAAAVAARPSVAVPVTADVSTQAGAGAGGSQNVPAVAELPAAGGTAASGECEDKAAFVADVSIDDGTSFAPGEQFVKIWRIRNAGTCTWQGYQLVFDEGDRMSAADPVIIPGTVAPDAMVDIQLALTAPNEANSYYSNWLLMTASGKKFGLGNPAIGLLWTKIGVRLTNDAGASDKTCVWTTDAAMEGEIFRLINAERAKAKLPPLTLNPKLSAAAREHSASMACNNYTDHYDRFNKTSWEQRIASQGVSFRDASENILWGYPTAEGAMGWWMGSKTHKDNILNPRSKQVGVGFAVLEGSAFTNYYTLNFIVP